mgnify:CR=1 FL=1
MDASTSCEKNQLKEIRIYKYRELDQWTIDWIILNMAILLLMWNNGWQTGRGNFRIKKPFV